MNLPGFRGEIRLNEPLSAHTSYRIGGPADLLAIPADREDLVVLLRELGERQLDFFVLGGGTNLLVRDGGFRGAAVSLERLKTLAVVREYHAVGGHYTAISADAGASLAALLAYAMDRGLTGLEFAAGIPGSVGGAVVMNAGTAEGEIGDAVESIALLAPGGAIITRGREEMGFGYRVSGVPERHVVLGAVVALRRDDPDAIRKRVRSLQDQRRQRQPWGQPNAGSVFKNPSDRSAGRLIETAGLKGKRVGDAQVSEKHANFIVNLGAATAADVVTLIEQVRQQVLDAHGVMLEPEIRIIGEE